MLRINVRPDEKRDSHPSHKISIGADIRENLILQVVVAENIDLLRVLAGGITEERPCPSGSPISLEDSVDFAAALSAQMSGSVPCFG
jgi:hypothetical protein